MFNLRLPLFILFLGFVACFYGIARRLLSPIWAFVATLFAIAWSVPVYPITDSVLVHPVPRDHRHLHDGAVLRDRPSSLVARCRVVRRSIDCDQGRRCLVRRCDLARIARSAHARAHQRTIHWAPVTCLCGNRHRCRIGCSGSSRCRVQRSSRRIRGRGSPYPGAILCVSVVISGHARMDQGAVRGDPHSAQRTGGAHRRRWRPACVARSALPALREPRRVRQRRADLAAIPLRLLIAFRPRSDHPPSCAAGRRRLPCQIATPAPRPTHGRRCGGHGHGRRRRNRGDAAQLLDPVGYDSRPSAVCHRFRRIRDSPSQQAG